MRDREVISDAGLNLLNDPSIRLLSFGDGRGLVREFWFGGDHPAPTAEELGDESRDFNRLLQSLRRGDAGMASLTIHWDDAFSIALPIPVDSTLVRIDSVLHLIDLVTELKPDTLDSEIWSVAVQRLQAPSAIASGFR